MHLSLRPFESKPVTSVIVNAVAIHIDEVILHAQSVLHRLLLCRLRRWSMRLSLLLPIIDSVSIFIDKRLLDFFLLLVVACRRAGLLFFFRFRLWLLRLRETHG